MLISCVVFQILAMRSRVVNRRSDPKQMGKDISLMLAMDYVLFLCCRVKASVTLGFAEFLLPFLIIRGQGSLLVQDLSHPRFFRMHDDQVVRICAVCPGNYWQILDVDVQKEVGQNTSLWKTVRWASLPVTVCF